MALTLPGTSIATQVDRYKQLLLKQRDIMIALTARLNERDEQIMTLQARRGSDRGRGGPVRRHMFWHAYWGACLTARLNEWDEQIMTLQGRRGLGWG